MFYMVDCFDSKIAHGTVSEWKVIELRWAEMSFVPDPHSISLASS